MREQAQGLALVSADTDGPYVLLSQVAVAGMDIVSAETGLSFYGLETDGGGPEPTEGELSRVYPGMVRVYPGIVRVYPI